MAKRRTDPDVDRLWDEFHESVNMSGRELRTWLLTEASSETGFQAGPDPGLPAPGRAVVDVLTKRKLDLTEADLELMASVVEQIRRLRASPPPDGPADTGWRHRLMNMGHDPLREPPEHSAA